MMLLSRFWYVLIGIALGVALYVVFLAVGQYNRKDQRLMTEGLASDSQTVEYVLKIDSRRRLDRLLVGSADKGLGDALVGAFGKRPLPAASKEAAKKALASVMDQIPPEFKPDYLFGVDREGRVIGEVGFDAVASNDEFELGGYPAVFDALHGFLRDDTWVWNGKLYIVSARPVETVAGEPPAGAIVGLKEISKTYAQEIAKRTRTNVAFYAGGKPVAVATPPRDASSPPGPRDIVDNQLQEIETELGSLSSDESYECPPTPTPTPCAGRSSFHSMSGDALGVMYARLNGDAWDQHAGFAVVRSTNPVGSPVGFLTNADDLDKKSAPIFKIALVVILAIAAGIGFTFLEHSMPLSELSRQAAGMREGKQDGLQVARFRGAYRLAAQNLNSGVDRIVEKGGGVGRKAADLESILGPVPAQPAMSAFSFPLQDGSNAGPPPAPPSGSGMGPAMMMGPPVPAPSSPGSVPGRPPPSAPQMMKPTPAIPITPGANAFPPGGGGSTMAMPNRPPPPMHAPPPVPVAPRPPPLGATPAVPPAAGRPAGAPPPPPPPPPPPLIMGKTGGEDAEDEEATMVAAIPAEVLAQATGENRKADGEAAEWLSVYEDFIRTKKQCGEATDGLTFEKFQHTLKKNRDALMARHGCKRVKFSVYVKEGRASLKATPVKD